jgi:osmotically-inducible protein OsmY
MNHAQTILSENHSEREPRRQRIRGGICLLGGVLFFSLTAVGAAQDQPADKTKTQSPAPGSANEPQAAVDLREVSDQLIMLAVENELLRSEAVNGHLIDVDVSDGIVTLSGRVNHLLAEQIAIGLAQRVRGVLSVIDEIEINLDKRDDVALKKDVEAALQADPATRHTHLEVKVEDGKVTLSGALPSHGEKTLAGEVAMGVKGVVELENNVTVLPNEKQTDSDLESEISELFRFAALLDDSQLEVSVKHGQVVLNGKVSSSFQKSHAEKLAWQAGAKDVDNRGVIVHWRHTNPLLRSERYEKATDAEIGEALRRAFKYDPRLLSFGPKAQVDHGVVTLTGDVGYLTAKRAAEQDALHTIGVRRVKNNLRVRWADAPPTDEQIADFTRQALARDPYVENNNIIVECENAHVSLYGLVDTQFERYHAEWITSRQNGVVHVNDYLAARKNWVPQSDAAIQADLDEKLAFTFVDPDNKVTSKVEDGVAILRGTVDTWLMWQTAMDQAIAAGARRPHNLIEVRYGLPSGPHYYGPHNYVPR